MTKIQLILKRRWMLVAACLVIGALAASLQTFRKSEAPIVQYQASQSVLLNLGLPTSGGSASLAQGAELMQQGLVPAKAAEILGYEGNPEELAEDISVDIREDSFSLRIQSIDESPERATEIVEAFAAAFIEKMSKAGKDQRDADLLSAESLAVATQATLDDFDLKFPDVLGGDPSNPVIKARQEERKILDREVKDAQAGLTQAKQAVNLGSLYYTQGPEAAEVVAQSSFSLPSSPLFIVGLLSLMGLGAGIALAVGYEKVNATVDLRSELTDEFGINVIGEIGKLPSKYQQKKRRSRITLELPSAEAYRRVRSVFQFAIQRRGQELGITQGLEQTPTTFMVISALPEEGKSTTVAMTALALAEAGTKTVGLGCDYRRPTIDKLLGVTASVGITDRAQPTIERPEIEEIIVPAPDDNLWVVPGGKPTSNVVGCGEVAKEVIASAKADGLVTIIDTTPILVANDAAELLDVVDEIVLVIRAGKTPKKAVHQVLDQLEQQNRSVLGAVLISSPDLRKMMSYYTDYYYDADHDDEELATPAKIPVA